MKKHQLSFILLPALFLLVIFITVGCNKSSSDSTVVPTLGTYPVVSGVTTTTAQVYGVVGDVGGAVLTEEGICYSATNQTPTINDSKITRAVDTAYIARTLIGLTPNTTYYARAYATNSAGTGYGGVVKFKTNTTTFAITATVSTFSGNGTSGLINGSAASSQYFNPQGVCADAAGNIYVADSYNNVIRKITPAGVSSTFAGSGAIGYIDGTAVNAAFYAPRAIAIDASGNLYVADLGNNIIRKITSAGVVSTLAGKGTPGYGDGTGTSAVFNAPSGIAVDASGNVFVADKGSNTIRKITSAGVVTTVAGSTARGQYDANGTTATFNSPAGITVDAAGNLYVADQNNYAIRKINTSGDVSTLMGNAKFFSTVFGMPSGIVVDASSNLFISDSQGRILELSSAGTLYSLAGITDTTGFTNGVNTGALFNSPQGITLNSAGNLFVADFYNNAIRRITLTTTP